jgi:hypothetical protein
MLYCPPRSFPTTAIDRRRYRVRKWDQYGRLVEDQTYEGRYSVTYDQPRVTVEEIFLSTTPTATRGSASHSTK